MMRKGWILLACGALGAPRASAQITDSYVELRLKNDNLGQVSNWLKTGDDLGETHSLLLTANFLKQDSLRNFRVRVETTEFAGLNAATPEPRDIFFTELNNFQLAVDNNKFRPGTAFYSLAAGLYYLQGNKLTIGATGQKYYLHEFVRKFYPGRYWVYDASPGKDRYIPYLEGKYGYNHRLFRTPRTSLSTIVNLEGRLASRFAFTGIGARGFADFKLQIDRFRVRSLDLELEGYYLTNVADYQIAYAQLGARLNFRHLSPYAHLNKPIRKYLGNPFIRHDDLDPLFLLGVAVTY